MPPATGLIRAKVVRARPENMSTPRGRVIEVFERIQGDGVTLRRVSTSIQYFIFARILVKCAGAKFISCARRRCEICTVIIPHAPGVAFFPHKRNNNKTKAASNAPSCPGTASPTGRSNLLRAAPAEGHSHQFKTLWKFPRERPTNSPFLLMWKYHQWPR
jgi:hypothetical protein